MSSIKPKSVRSAGKQDRTVTLNASQQKVVKACKHEERETPFKGIKGAFEVDVDVLDTYENSKEAKNAFSLIGISEGVVVKILANHEEIEDIMKSGVTLVNNSGTVSINGVETDAVILQEFVKKR